MHKIRVLVADKNELFSQSLKLLLEKYTDIEISGVESAPDRLASAIQSRPFEVLLLDVNLAGENVAETVAKLRTIKPVFKLILLVNKSSDGYLELYKNISGIQSTLSKNAGLDEVLSAIRE